MPSRPRYDPHQAHRPAQTLIDFDAPLPEPKPAAPADKVTEPPPPEYHIAPSWIDTAGRTRTWALKNPHGTQMAEITTKSAALRLAELLNNVMSDERGPAR